LHFKIEFTKQKIKPIEISLMLTPDSLCTYLEIVDKNLNHIKLNNKTFLDKKIHPLSSNKKVFVFKIPNDDL
jgi:hypothetical protein